MVTQYIIATIANRVKALLAKLGGSYTTSGCERDGAAPAPLQALGAGSVPSTSGAPANIHILTASNPSKLKKNCLCVHTDYSIYSKCQINPFSCLDEKLLKYSI